MAMEEQRNPLMAWIIGLIIVAIADVYMAYLFFATECQAPGIAQFMLLVVLPAVYLVLMYLTLKRQP